MSFYNTGNPVPSIDPRDLDDNAKHLDVAIHSAEDTWVDRLGATRKSIKGVENGLAVMQEGFDDFISDSQDEFNAFLAGTQYEVPVAYTAGLSITRAAQTVIVSGIVYRPIPGSLPFVTTTFGADAAKWTVLGDASLRQDMSSSVDPSNGAALSGFGETLAYPDGTVGKALTLRIENESMALDRYLVESSDKPHPGTYSYTSFFGGAQFRGREFYFARNGYEHVYNASKDPASLVFWIREANGQFVTKGVFYNGYSAGQDVRDPWATPTPVAGDNQLLLKVSASTAGAAPFTHKLWVLASNLTNVFGSPYDINIGSDQFMFGHTLVTPVGHLLITAYNADSNGVNLWRSVGNSIATTPSFTNVKTLFPPSAAKPNEACLSYWGDKLICVSRQSSGNMIFTWTYDLEGLTGWSAPVTLPFYGHAAVVEPYIPKGEPLIVGFSGIAGDGLRKTIAFAGSYDGKIWSSATSYLPNTVGVGGYMTMVPNRHGYGVMYYEESASDPLTKTNVWFKDLNVPAIFINKKITERSIKNVSTPFVTQFINSKIVYGSPLAIDGKFATNGNTSGATLRFKKVTPSSGVLSVVASNSGTMTAVATVYREGVLVATSAAVSITTGVTPKLTEFVFSYTFDPFVEYRILFGGNAGGNLTTYKNTLPSDINFKTVEIDYGWFVHSASELSGAAVNAPLSIGVISNQLS